MNENLDKNITPENTDGNKSSPDKDEKTPQKLAKSLFEWLETFAFAFAFVLVVFTFAFKIVTVNGESMNYTLAHNEKLIISNLFYEPQTGDIVIVSRERFGQEPIVKRVIATEGQRVDIDFGKKEVRVDGVLLDEPYTVYQERDITGTLIESDKMNKGLCPASFTVGKDCIFVMGDNRNNSTDSRVQGTFDKVDGEMIYTGFMEEDVIGKVMIRVLPLNKFGEIKPATDIPVVK